MKRVTCLVVVLIFYIAAHSQIAYHTARGIRDNCVDVTGNSFVFKRDPNAISMLSAFLKNYLPGTIRNDALLEDQVFDHFNDNPFFGPQVLRLSGASSGFLSNIISSTTASVGGIAIPNEVLLGVTDWIVNRTKQELNVFFFDNFKKKMEHYPDLRTVFPQTYRALNVLGDELYNYQRYIKTLRAAFQNDARDLTKNLPRIISNHPSFFELHPGLAATFNSGFYIAGALQDKIHPGDIINDYPPDYLDPLKVNWKGAIQTLQLISASLRDTVPVGQPGAAYWVSYQQVKALASDKIAFKIYLGLLYQQAKTTYDSIHFKTKQVDTTLIGILGKMALDYQVTYSAYAGFISHFSEKTNKLNQLINDYREPAIDSISFQHYYDYYSSVIDLFRSCTEISKLPTIKEFIPDLTDSLEDYFDVARTAADLFLNIKQHNYSSAIISTVHIYDMVKALQAEKDIMDISLEQRLRDLAKTFMPAKANLFHYGSFMAAISEADSPEEVEKIIETFALPQGSSRIKRRTRFNVALNAYCGLFTGHEKISGVKEKKEVNTYGLTAPIGVSVSHGTSKGWSHTGFISIIDLGAVAAFRFAADSTAQVPTIRLKNIFSPGVFYSLGIRNTPLSLNLGAQVGPNLRKVTSSVNNYADKTYIRYSFSLCVDLPILNLYTRTRL